MEEAFPIRFTRGIRSYWRRHKYQRVDGSAGRGTRRAHHLVRLGGGGDGRTWAVRFGDMFRARVKVPTAPMHVLGRVRDAYIDAMLGVAKKRPATALSLLNGPEAFWSKRVPVSRSRPARHDPTEFGQRLVMEMYRSVVASRELTGMLRASTAR